MQNIKKIFSSLFLITIAFWWLPFSIRHHESHEGGNDFIMHHVVDSYSAHFGNVVLHLPIIIFRKGKGFSCFSSRHLEAPHGKHATYQGITLKEGHLIDQGGSHVYDFSITKNVFFMLLSLLLLLLLFISTRYHYINRRGRARGIFVIFLYLIRFIRDNVAKENIHAQHYKRFTPYLLTLFSYIFLNNLLGLLPGGGNVTGNLSIVCVLAFITFVLTNGNGNKNYWKHIFNPPGVPKWLLPILVPIELFGVLIRPFTLMLRLFVNMLSGHLLLTVIIGLIFILDNLLIATIAVPFGTAILLLKIFVSFLQAYVFTLLTAISIGTALEEH